VISGYEYEDYENDAIAAYCDAEGVADFEHVACWRYLKQFDKWSDAGLFRKKKSNKRRRTVSPSLRSEDYDFDVFASNTESVLGEDNDNDKDKEDKRPIGCKAAKAMEFEKKCQVSSVKAQKLMADCSARRVQLMEEQNDIAACAADPDSEYSKAFFAAHSKLAMLKAQAALAAFENASSVAAGAGSEHRARPEGGAGARSGADAVTGSGAGAVTGLNHSVDAGFEFGGGI
jgi:hypothetical protein